MIQSFADDTSRDLFYGDNTKAARRIPRTIRPIAQRKMKQIDLTRSLDELRTPPSNRLHPLLGDRVGQYAIWVNTQYRITFRWEGHDAYDVCCEDYH